LTVIFQKNKTFAWHNGPPYLLSSFFSLPGQVVRMCGDHWPGATHFHTKNTASESSRKFLQTKMKIAVEKAVV